MDVWVVHGLLTRAVDGDTVVADLDLGWHVWLRDTKIRIAGINAPELNTVAGKAARDEMRKFEGAEVEVTSHSLDKYGRVLGAVVTHAGEDIAAHMLAGGFAVVYP